MALVKFVYVRKFYKMFIIFFTTMTSIDTRKSTLNYYIDTAHRAVIFAERRVGPCTAAIDFKRR